MLHIFSLLLIASTKDYQKEGRKIDDYIIRRALEVGQYIAETGATVRQAAKKFGVSKSSVHKDMDKRLSEISPGLFFEVQQVLKYNKAVRHLRGGAATRLKYALAKRTHTDLAGKKEFTQQM